MFANAFRRQARLAVLTLSRSRTLTTTPLYSSLWRSLATNRTANIRLLSTSSVLANEQAEDTKREVKPTEQLFIGNLPFSVEEADLRDKFAVFGEIKDVRIAQRMDGSSRGFAHVEFANTEDAAAAFESSVKEPFFLFGRVLRVDYATGSKKGDHSSTPNQKLFFWDYLGDERSIRQILNDFEKDIMDVFFLRNPRTGEFLGKGFVDLVNVDRASAALQVLKSEGLKSEYARPRNTQQQRSWDSKDTRREDTRRDRTRFYQGRN